MSVLLEKIRREIRQLSFEEQEVLAADLLDAAWDNSEPANEVEATWDQEIIRRVEEVRSGTVRMVPWKTVTASIAEEFGWNK